MSNEEAKMIANPEPDAPNHALERYQAPVLRALGDVRDLTLGGSAGVPESGGGPTDFEN